MVDCHIGVLGSNSGGPKDPWNYFTGGSGNSVAPESASGSGNWLYTVVVDARLSGNKRGNSVVTVSRRSSGFESWRTQRFYPWN